MREVAIIGVGMTPFGKFLNRSLEDLSREAVWNAIEDANIPAKNIQVAHVANSYAGSIAGQESIQGQVMLQDCGFHGIPIVNIENACAGGTTALRGIWLEISSGLYDVGLALGVEKLYTPSTSKSISILAGSSMRLYNMLGFQFTAAYAFFLRKYMGKYGVTKEDFAKVVVKNSYNGSLNPLAQHRIPLTIDEVVNSRMVCAPLTLYMCSSIADGAAAAILCSKDVARRYTSKPLIEIAGCGLKSGLMRLPGQDEVPFIAALTANEAYQQAGVGPEDIDVAEVHDAMAPAEMLYYEELGFCGEGEGRFMLDQKRTWITGDKPVNPSGGLAAKGHPVSATGLAQVAEIVWQLRGEAGKRQVTNNPKVGLIENAGGWLGEDNAACSVTILKK